MGLVFSGQYVALLSHIKVQGRIQIFGGFHVFQNFYITSEVFEK